MAGAYLIFGLIIIITHIGQLPAAIALIVKAAFNPQAIAQQLKHFATQYGLDPKVVYPHSFRHRFAKNFLEKYNDIAFLADLMGHESIETTRIYLRRTATEQQQLVDRIVTW